MSTNVLLLFAVSLAWACDYLFVGWADRSLPPITAAASMTAVAALVLLPFVRFVLRRPLLATLKAAPAVPLVMALGSVALPKLSVVAAEESITPDLAALVGTTVPILTVLVSVFVTRQSAYGTLRMAGILVAFGGMLVFVGLGDLAAQQAELWGMATMMAGGVAFALNGVYASLKAKDLDPFALTAWVLLFGAIGLTVAALAFEAEGLQMPPPAAIASVAGSGLLSMGLAYLGYYALIARAGATFTSCYAYLVPPLGLATGVVILGEPLSAEHLGGVALVLLGLWMIAREPRGTRIPPARAAAS